MLDEGNLYNPYVGMGNNPVGNVDPMGTRVLVYKSQRAAFSKWWKKNMSSALNNMFKYVWPQKNEGTYSKKTRKMPFEWTEFCAGGPIPEWFHDAVAWCYEKSAWYNDMEELVPAGKTFNAKALTAKDAMFLTMLQSDDVYVFDEGGWRLGGKDETPNTLARVDLYVGDMQAQIMMGDRSGKSNVGGSAGQIALSFAGLDLPQDLSNLSYSFETWTWSWDHAGTTTMNFIALAPVLGMSKPARKGMNVIADVGKSSKGTDVILRVTKDKRMVIDVTGGGVKGILASIMAKTKLWHYEDHHIVFKMLGGTEEAANKVGIRAFLHRGKRGVGFHQHVLDALGHKSYAAYKTAIEGMTLAQRKVHFKKLRGVYSSFFEGSKDHKQIMEIIDAGLATARKAK